MRIWAVALNTFKETIRNRILLNILFFAIGLILLSLVVGEWSMYQQVKVIKDFGLSAMSIFGLLIAVFIGIRLMVQELEQKTIYLIISKPIRRWEFVLGKYLGLSITLALNVLLMSLALWGASYLMEGYIDWSLTPAIILLYVEILLVVAFSMLFSSFMMPTVSAIATLMIFIVGHLSDFLMEFIALYPDKGYHWLLNAIYHVAPNLEKLNLKIAVVEDLPYDSSVLTFGLLYGFSYILILLIITAIVFERKDLK
ncbi:ABC transporter permease subunit [candidate division KSB1 bacterium]|nr:ABC transporter permease subunit [candidate division KSB1 bacterium]